MNQELYIYYDNYPFGNYLLSNDCQIILTLRSLDPSLSHRDPFLSPTLLQLSAPQKNASYLLDDAESPTSKGTNSLLSLPACCN